MNLLVLKPTIQVIQVYHTSWIDKYDSLPLLGLGLQSAIQGFKQHLDEEILMLGMRECEREVNFHICNEEYELQKID